MQREENTIGRTSSLYFSVRTRLDTFSSKSKRNSLKLFMAKVSFMFDISHENSPFLSNFSFSRKMYFKRTNQLKTKKQVSLTLINITANLSRTFSGYCKYEALSPGLLSIRWMPTSVSLTKCPDVLPDSPSTWLFQCTNLATKNHWRSKGKCRLSVRGQH